MFVFGNCRQGEWGASGGMELNAPSVSVDVPDVSMEGAVTLTSAPELTTLPLTMAVVGGVEVEVPSVDVSGSAGSAKGGWGWSWPSIKMPGFKLPKGSVELPDGSIKFPDGRIQMPDDSMKMPDALLAPHA